MRSRLSRRVALTGGVALALASTMAAPAAAVLTSAPPAQVLAAPNIAVSAVKAHLAQLQAIATSNGGTPGSRPPRLPCVAGLYQGRLTAPVSQPPSSRS